MYVPVAADEPDVVVASVTEKGVLRRATAAPTPYRGVMTSRRYDGRSVPGPHKSGSLEVPRLVVTLTRSSEACEQVTAEFLPACTRLAVTVEAPSVIVIWRLAESAGPTLVVARPTTSACRLATLERTVLDTGASGLPTAEPSTRCRAGAVKEAVAENPVAPCR